MDLRVRHGPCFSWEKPVGVGGGVGIPEAESPNRIWIRKVMEEDRDFWLLCASGVHMVPLSKCQLFLRPFLPAQLPCGLGPSSV